MTPYHKRVTAFTKRMAEDKQLRNLSPRTIDAYTYHVDRFAMRYGKHPKSLPRTDPRLSALDDQRTSRLLEPIQPSRLCIAVLLYRHLCERLGGSANPVRA